MTFRAWGLRPSRPSLVSQSGIICIAVIVSSVKGGCIPRIQWGIESEPTNEIRIGNEWLCIHNGIGAIGCYGRFPDALVNPPTARNVPSYNWRRRSMGLNGGGATKGNLPRG